MFNMKSIVWQCPLIVLLPLLYCVSLTVSTSDITANDLRCEYLRNGTGIESQTARLTWVLNAIDPTKRNLRQSAYQILVASSLEILSNNTGDQWDSGKVLSNLSAHVKYAGK